MATLVGNPNLLHPSKKLRAGQVDKFAKPQPTNLVKCQHCGQLYNNATYHPGNTG
jgi:hypothetical protein